MNLDTRLIFGMKAYLINTHLLVPRSRSSAKVKVRYQGHSFFFIERIYICPFANKLFENSDADLSWLLFQRSQLVQNKVRVICNRQKVCPCFFGGSLPPYLFCRFMKTLFTSSATTNRTPMALIYTID